MVNNLSMINSETTPDDPNEQDASYRNLLLSIYSFMIVIGLIGNFIILYMSIFNKNLNLVRNAFLINLLVAKIYLLLITPFYMLYIYNYGTWNSGELSCKFVNASKVIIILVSSLSLTMIAIERWLNVVFSYMLKMKNTLFIIIVIWIIGILISWPVFHFRQLKNPLDEYLSKNNFSQLEKVLAQIDVEFYQQYDCVEMWPDKILVKRSVFMIILFMFEFILPFLCMCVAYGWLLWFLKDHQQKMSRYRSSIITISNRRQNNRSFRIENVSSNRNNKNNFIILFMLCLLFLLSWLPLSLYSVLTELGIWGFVFESHGFLLIKLLTLLEMMDAVLSSLMYGWLNQNYRREISFSIKKFKSKFFNTAPILENDVELDGRKDTLQLRSNDNNEIKKGESECLV